MALAAVVAWSMAFGQMSIVDKPTADGWRTSVDDNAPGATQSVAAIADAGGSWLKWSVTTNRDGKFTGYELLRDVSLDLSAVETLRWRWMTVGTYLQIQFWAGDKLAYWDSADLKPGQWRTETLAPAQFHLLAGFTPADWAHVTRIGLRIADSFGGYQEGTRYDIGLAFVHGYGPVPAPGPRVTPPAALTVDDGAKLLSVGSASYRVELSRDKLGMQLYLPDSGRLTPLSKSGFFWGFDQDKARSFDAKPVYEIVEKSPGKVVVAAAEEFPLTTHDAALITFTFLPDRFYTAVKYYTPLDAGYLAARYAPSADATKGLFDRYAFRDDAGRLHRGAFAEYRERSGFGLSSFDVDGDFVPAFSAEKPYLYLWKNGGGRGLAVVYLDYAEKWRGAVDNCHFCYYTPDLDYFHLGLATGCDCEPTRTACFLADPSGDVGLMDTVVAPEVLAEAKSLHLEAKVPAGFTIRTDRGDAQRKILARLQETWGNHMHWCGVGWGGPNGDDVLATSIDLSERMLAMGATGAVNFDMVGVERLVTERPAAIEKLKRLLATGKLEIVGATYSQPLGNFNGAESNVRQLQWGVDVCEKYLGVRPKTWWEEEFYFFPQLAQLLRLTGFDGACLYFQQTWMEPAFPHEDGTSVVQWQAPDGSRIKTAAHTALTTWMPGRLDPRALADVPIAKKADTPLIVHWNELTGTDPKNTDMYRQTYDQMSRYAIKTTTLSDYLAAYKGTAPVRAYKADQTFHGLPLGKCGDQVRRADKRLENTLTAAEALGAGASMEGLPYPAAALREAWKNLLIFQGHDVHICEGCLRGSYPQYQEAADTGSRKTLDGITTAAEAKIDTRHPGAQASIVVFNPLAWTRSGPVEVPLPDYVSPGNLAAEDDKGGLTPVQMVTGARLLFIARDVPPVGYRTFWFVTKDAPSDLKVSPDGASMANSSVSAKLNPDGSVHSLKLAADGADLLSAGTPNGELRATVAGKSLSSSTSGATSKPVESGPVRAVVETRGSLDDHAHFVNRTVLYAGLPQVSFETDLDVTEHLDGLMTGALRRVFTPAFRARYFHDQPFGVSETAMANEFLKYFPFVEGRREDHVRNHVAGLNFLDCQGDRAGLLYAHDGNQGFLRVGAEIANILSCYDPWDGDYYPTRQEFREALIPHGAWTNADRLRASIAFNTPLIGVISTCQAGTLPNARSWLSVSPSGSIVSGFYRDGDDLIVRLYDVDGARTQTHLTTPWPIASARLEDLRGKPLRTLRVEKNGVDLALAPYQIATVRLRPTR
jgi:alpha-mannosidase